MPLQLPLSPLFLPTLCPIRLVFVACLKQVPLSSGFRLCLTDTKHQQYQRWKERSRYLLLLLPPFRTIVWQQQFASTIGPSSQRLSVTIHSLLHQLRLRNSNYFPVASPDCCTIPQPIVNSIQLFILSKIIYFQLRL